MKRAFYIFILISFSRQVLGQTNLVLNPSFEDTINCPTNGGQITMAKFWSNPTLTSPDYFNSCSGNLNIKTPINAYGFQNTKTGNSYAGFYSYLDNTSDFSEYIQGELSTQLINGVQYCVSFYANLSDSSMYSSNDIGVYFSSSQQFFSVSQSLTLTPVYSNSIVAINDKFNWKLISFNYTAIGGEKYFIIGNFKNNIQTSATFVGGATGVNGVYFLIDDVSVIASPCLTGIVENNFQAKTLCFPNPASDYIYFNFESRTNNIKVNILNNHGQVLISKTFSSDDRLDLTKISDGFYSIQLTIDGISFYTKIIVKH